MIWCLSFAARRGNPGLVYILHFVFLAGVAGLVHESNAATKTWTSEGDGIRWDNAANWSGISVPSSGDTALFSTFGSGGTIRFTDGSSYTANVSTIIINSVPTQYNNFNAGTASSSVATINFGSTAAAHTNSTSVETARALEPSRPSSEAL